MMRIGWSRFLAPCVVVTAGSTIAGAVAIGHTWGDALIAEIVTLVLAVGYYLLTGSDADIGAIYAHRSDERQAIVRMNASRLAFVVMIGAAFICAVISVALNDNYWQADVIGSVGGVAFVFGLMRYGAHGEHAPRENVGIMEMRSMSSSADLDD